MDTKAVIAAWVKESRLAADLSQEALGAQLALVLGVERGHTKGNISHWETGKHQPSLQQLIAIGQITKKSLPPEVLGKQEPHTVEQERGAYGNHPMRRAADFELVSAEDTELEVGKIEYWDARGSCGGGFLNYDQMPKGHLVKEHTFFQKFGVKPSNAFAIYADGESMANFIVGGDIVIFDRSRVTPQSGKIYAIDHPDGLRIKRLRRGIDGAWMLESDNPDKRAYPDERIEPDQMDLLKIHGEFVYRQGG